MRAFVTSLSLLAVVSLATACERSESSSTDDTHATQVVGAVALPPEPTLPANLKYKYEFETKIGYGRHLLYYGQPADLSP
jgi:hypothetical protein